MGYLRSYVRDETECVTEEHGMNSTDNYIDRHSSSKAHGVNEEEWRVILEVTVSPKNFQRSLRCADLKDALKAKGKHQHA